MEAAAEAEIAVLQTAREALAERQAEAEQERKRSEMEREEMGATWGMGEYNRSSFIGGYSKYEPLLLYNMYDSDGGGYWRPQE